MRALKALRAERRARLEQVGNVRLLAQEADLVVRYQGGNNAGHTIVIDDETFALSLTPSGVIYPGVIPVIGNGCVVDPAVLLADPQAIRREVEATLRSFGPGEGHVFNLGHGITPGVNPDHVTAFVDAVIELSPQYHRD